MKIYSKKSVYFKRYNLNGREVAVMAYGYRVDCRTGADGAVLHVYIEKQFGWWYATEYETGLSISNFGCKTRKAMAEYVESEKERIYKKVQEILEHHKSVYDLGGPSMTYDEYSAALHAEDAEKVTDNETAEPEPTTEEEPQEVETTETEVSYPESRYNDFMQKMSKSETLEDLKRVYSDEYSEVCYDVDLLKDLDLAYEDSFDAVRCLHRTKSGKVYSTESAANHETVGFFPEFVEAISNMNDVYFNIEGTWMWVSGNTKPHREELKRLGLRWAPKRKMWYKKPAEKCPAAV